LKHQIAKTRKRTAVKPAPIRTLELPADDLGAMHAGLACRVSAWRDAHNAATARLGALLERTDLILDRFAQKH
jgi:hypothetical protein